MVESEAWPSLSILWVEIPASAHDVLLGSASGGVHDVRAEHHILPDGPGETLGAVHGVHHAGMVIKPILTVRLHPFLVVHTLESSVKTSRPKINIFISQPAHPQI